MVSCPLLPLSVGTDTPGRRRRPLSTLTSSVNLASSGEPLYRRKAYRLLTVKKKALIASGAPKFRDSSKKDFTAAEGCGMLIISVCRISWGRTTGPQACIIFYLIMLKKGR